MPESDFVSRWLKHIILPAGVLGKVGWVYYDHTATSRVHVRHIDIEHFKASAQGHGAHETIMLKNAFSYLLSRVGLDTDYI